MYTNDTSPSVILEGSVPWVKATALPPEPGFILLELEVTPPGAGSIEEQVTVRVGEDEPLLLALRGLVRE